MPSSADKPVSRSEPVNVAQSPCKALDGHSSPTIRHVETCFRLDQELQLRAALDRLVDIVQESQAEDEKTVRAAVAICRRSRVAV